MFCFLYSQWLSHWDAEQISINIHFTNYTILECWYQLLAWLPFFLRMCCRSSLDFILSLFFLLSCISVLFSTLTHFCLHGLVFTWAWKNTASIETLFQVLTRGYGTMIPLHLSAHNCSVVYSSICHSIHKWLAKKVLGVCFYSSQSCTSGFTCYVL